MPLLLVAMLLVFVLVVAMPLSLVQRYRMGTSRRRARGWVATFNMAGLALSAAMVLVGAALTSMWVPGAFTYTAAGFVAGCIVGLAGLLLTRWEPVPGALYDTPNRWLVLGLTLVVAARIAYGFWRGWHTWRLGFEGGSWFAASGAAGSMAAGAVVLGYYFAYWAGLRRRFRRHASRR